LLESEERKVAVKKDPKPAPWTRDLRDVLIRLIDRDHVGSALALLALVILLVVALRMPTEALGQIPTGIGWLFTQQSALAIFAATSAVLSVACLMLLGLVLALRRTHRTEMDRMAAVKRRLELKLDKNRPRTYPQEVPRDERLDDEEAKAKAKPEAEAKPEAARVKPKAAAKAKPEATAKAKSETTAKAKPEATAKAKPEATTKAKAAEAEAEAAEAEAAETEAEASEEMRVR
jgi:hypothetical protein